jgi:hypothetical protein
MGKKKSTGISYELFVTEKNGHDSYDDENCIQIFVGSK